MSLPNLFRRLGHLFRGSGLLPREVRVYQVGNLSGPNGQTDPVPWDGASDLRVYLIDNLINDKVAMILEAINKSSLVAQPVDRDAPVEFTRLHQSATPLA